MEDSTWKYGVRCDSGSIPRRTFPVYLSSEASALTNHHTWNSNNLQGSSSDYLQNDNIPSHPPTYCPDDYLVPAAHCEPSYSGFTAEKTINGYQSPPDDSNLHHQRPDVPLGATSGIPDIINERPGSFRRADSVHLSVGESNILFVDGLPKDCTRREVGHLFRPFIGFRDIRVVHKEARHRGDKAVVLCFVEFADTKCAQTALEALQGYKFDDKKPDSPALRIHFAQFPFSLPI